MSAIDETSDGKSTEDADSPRNVGFSTVKPSATAHSEQSEPSVSEKVTVAKSMMKAEESALRVTESSGSSSAAPKRASSAGTTQRVSKAGSSVGMSHPTWRWEWGGWGASS
jgi:hypothetical protein